MKLPDRPGELARVSGALRDGGVNIRAVAAHPEAETIRMVTSDPRKTRMSLNKSNIEFSERNLLVAKLKDYPGELARVSNALAFEGINIDTTYMLDKNLKNVLFGFGVSDEDKARKVLEQLMDRREKIVTRHLRELHKIDEDTRKAIDRLTRKLNKWKWDSELGFKDLLKVINKIKNGPAPNASDTHNLKVMERYLNQAEMRIAEANILQKERVKPVDDLIRQYQRKIEWLQKELRNPEEKRRISRLWNTDDRLSKKS